VNPLYAPAHTWFGDDHQMPHCEVWQPHFEPLLIDSLAEDVFGRQGSIVRLNDFADCPRTTFFDPTFFLGANVISLVLAGERDRAAEFVTLYQNDEGHTGAAKQVIQECWDRVSGDIEKVCQECHAYEAAKVKALKLEHVWEPSPFPVELPAAERSRVSEPSFAKTPWISTPPWLYGEMPDEPGEVRFGKDVHHRNGRDLFVVPLTGEEAEKRHDWGQSYVRAERLADGSLVQISDRGVKWLKSPYVLRVRPSQDFEDRSMIVWWMFSVREQTTGREVWLSYADGQKGERSIYDWRGRDKGHESAPLTPVESKLVKCPTPRFGDYTELLTRIQSLLETAGYGPWP